MKTCWHRFRCWDGAECDRPCPWRWPWHLWWSSAGRIRGSLKQQTKINTKNWFCFFNKLRISHLLIKLIAEIFIFYWQIFLFSDSIANILIYLNVVNQLLKTNYYLFGSWLERRDRPGSPSTRRSLRRWRRGRDRTSVTVTPSSPAVLDRGPVEDKHSIDIHWQR